MTTVDDKLQFIIDKLFNSQTIHITYPIEDKKDLPTGITTIDFVKGDVTLPGYTNPTELTSTNVQDTPLRSIFIYIESMVKVTLMYGKEVIFNSDIPASSLRLDNIQFDRLKIETYKPTLFWCLASTDPKGALIDLQDFYEGLPYTVRGTLTSNVETEIDIRTNLGRNARSGYLGNFGEEPVTPGYIKVYENDGTGYTSDYYTIEEHGMIQWEKADLSKIKIVSPIDGTSYELHVR